MKIIKISNCDDCPYHKKADLLSVNEPFCSELDKSMKDIDFEKDCELEECNTSGWFSLGRCDSTGSSIMIKTEDNISKNPAGLV